MSEEKIGITFPVGRMVYGDVYSGRTKDDKGQPLVIKNGPNAGQPRTEYAFGVAIPKGSEQYWNHTAWGQQIYALALKEWPQGQWQNPAFSWKIEDGDSRIPNKNNRVNADTEGYPGCWILKFASNFAPQIYNRDGTQLMVEPGAVQCGYYIQVYAEIKSNESTQSPGMYLNPSLVAFNAYGTPIVRKGSGPDASTVGFGQSSAPAGAMATPPAGLPPIAAPLTPPVAPVVPVAAPPVAVPPPAPAILQPPAPPARQLTAKANGASYEQLIAAGWTDDLLRANGLMV